MLPIMIIRALSRLLWAPSLEMQVLGNTLKRNSLCLSCTTLSFALISRSVPNCSLCHSFWNSIVYQLWRWNFSGFGISDKQETVLGCECTVVTPKLLTDYLLMKIIDTYCMSIVDISALTTSEFVFLISESACESVCDSRRYCWYETRSK